MKAVKFKNTTAGLAFAALGLLASVTASMTAANAASLKLGNEGTNPPFSVVAGDGTLSGLEPDLAREMCKRMGDECEFVVMDFMALVPSLMQGKFDLLVGNMTPSAERKEKMLFTRPIVSNPVTFVVPKDSDYTFTKEGLAGKSIKIGLQRGDNNAKFIEKTFGDAVEYSYYDNPEQTILDLTAGRINMLFMPKITAALRLIDTADGKNWKFAGGDHYIGQEDIPEKERGNAWPLRKTDAELVSKINATLDAMLADCTYTQIRKRYISTSLLPEDEACVKAGK